MRIVLKETRSGMKTNRLLLILVIIICCFLACVLTLKITDRHYYSTVTVEATGERNDVSLGGGAVAVSEIKIGRSCLDFSNGLGDWRYLYGSLNWNYYEGKTFTVDVPIYKSAEISFIQNAYAGIVRVTVEDKSETIDLYSEADGTYKYVIDAAPMSEIANRMWPMGILLMFEFILIFVIALVLVAYLPVKIYPDSKEKQKLLPRLSGYICQRPATTIRLLVLAISFFVMWHFAGAFSLWSDDLVTIDLVSKEKSLGEFFSNMMIVEAPYNPPLFYFFAYIWLRIAPYGTAYLKLLSIIFCLLGIWTCGAVAKRVQGDRAAVITTALAATSYFLVNYAAYTFRCYGLLFLGCSFLIMAYYARLKEPNRIRNHIVYGITLAVVIYTNYIGVLVFAAQFFFDFYLFCKKKIKLNCIFSYIGAGISYLPLIFSVYKTMIEGHKNFWVPTPTIGSLIDTVRLIFSNQGLAVVIFFGTAIFLLCKGQNRISFCERQEDQWAMQSMAFCFLFVMGSDYVFSRYIIPTSSIFFGRYFICALPSAMIVLSVGIEWLLEAVCEEKSATSISLFTVVLITACYLSGAYKEYGELKVFPGTLNSRLEETIDWIYYNNGEADNTLVMMSYPLGGFQYYAEKGGNLPGLDFGTLTSTNWQSYEKVFAAPIQNAVTQEEQQILDENYTEIGRNDDLSIIIYQRNS